MADETSPKMDIAQALGSPLTIDWDGHPYKFSPLVDGIKADYVAWLKSCALADAAQADNEGRVLVWTLVTTKQYDWYGTMCQASLKGVPGMISLATLMLSAAGQAVDYDEVDALIHAKEDEFTLLVKLATEEAHPKSRATFLAKKAAKSST